MSEARVMILKMLAEGKITVEESERLLAAINDKEQSSQDCQKKRENSQNYFEPFSEALKFGRDMKNIAKTIHNNVNQVIKKAEPRSEELKDKIKDFGNRVQDIFTEMANEITLFKGEATGATTVDFVLSATPEINECKIFQIENIFGEIRVHSGPQFKLKVSGYVSSDSFQDINHMQWFLDNAIYIEDKVFKLDLRKQKFSKATLDFDITIPENSELSCKTLSSDIRIQGKYLIKHLETVGGQIRLMGATLIDSTIKTVSGDVQIEGGEIAIQIKSTSGDFLIKESNIEKLIINSVSGDILLTEATISNDTSVKLVTTSGDIMVDKINGPWSLIEARSRTGDVILSWKGHLIAINNQSSQLKSGDEGASFKVESVSGDIQFS